MLFRKWIVRGLVLLVVAGCLGAGVIYQQWTNPSAVRQQVVDMLHKQFPGAAVTLDGARWRILGGVVLTELRLIRQGAGKADGENPDGPDQTDLVHIPRATVYLNKDKLLEDKPTVQRIEMHKPFIRIVRNKDGKWNVDGLTGNSDPNAPLPIIWIDNGTLVIEDLLAGVTRELHNLDLTLVNEGANCLGFQGTGQSDTMGAITVAGTLNRATNAVTLALQTTGLCINNEVMGFIASQFHHQEFEGLKLEGKADIEAKLSYLPKASPAWQHEVHCLLRQTSIEHPKLPMPLHNLTASIHCGEGKLRLEKLKAAAGAGKIECRGWADLADLQNTFAGEMTAYYLPITEELVKQLPLKAQELHFWFKPHGAAKVHVVAEKYKGHWLRAHGTLEPDNISVCFEKFPYPLDRVTGFIDFDYLQHHSKFDVVGYSGTQPVTIRGQWKDFLEKADATIEITGQNLALDDKVLNALPGFDKETNARTGLSGLAASFHAKGKGNFRALVQRIPGSRDFRNTYQIHFVDSSVKWDEFPYPLENVEGDLVIYPHKLGEFDSYEFTNFKGTHNGGEVLVQGSTLPRSDAKIDGKLLVNITGHNIALDDDLRQALEKNRGLRQAWDAFAPTGRLHFQAHAEKLPGQTKEKVDMDIAVTLAGCTILPTFFPYGFHDVAGQFHYHKNKVDLINFSGRHNHTQLSISKGAVDLFGNHGFYVELDDLRANPLLADEELLTALPQALRKISETVHLKNQTVAMQTKLVVSQPDDPKKVPEIFWDGLMWVRDANLAAGIELNHVSGTVACRGLYDGKKIAGLSGNIYLKEATILKQPFQGVRSHFQVRDDAPDVMLLTLNAPLFDGEVSGQGRVEFNACDSSLRDYELDLTASQVQLEKFGRYNLGSNHQLAGIAAGRLHLQGRGGEDAANSLEGNGSIDVPYSPMTRLLNLPLLLDLLKFLGLRWPDRTMFEEAHAAFAIHGNRASIDRLDLQGNAVSLYGKGEVNLDGSDLQLDMYSSWGRAEQLLPSVVRSVPSAISKQLLRIEARGKIGGTDGDLKFSKHLVPGLIDPLTDMSNRLLGIGNR